MDSVAPRLAEAMEGKLAMDVAEALADHHGRLSEAMQLSGSRFGAISEPRAPAERARLVAVYKGAAPGRDCAPRRG